MQQKVVYLHAGIGIGNIGDLEKKTASAIEEQAEKGFELMGTPSISHSSNGLVVVVALAFREKPGRSGA